MSLTTVGGEGRERDGDKTKHLKVRQKRKFLA